MLRPRVGIALGGGAARGGALIGVLAALEQLGVRIDCIAGTSIGALVGACYALEPDAAALARKVAALADDGTLTQVGLAVFGPRRATTWEQFKMGVAEKLMVGRALFAEALVKPEPVRRVIGRLLGDVTFQDLRVRFGAVALDLTTGDDRLLSAATLGPGSRVATAVLASSSIPGIFPPVLLDGHRFTDGGITTNIPIRAARRLGADVVIAVDLGAELGPPGDLKTGVRIVMRADQIARYHLRRAARAAADVLIQPALADLHWMDFTRLDEGIAAGRQSTFAQADRIRFIQSRRYHVRRRVVERLSHLLLGKEESWKQS